MTNSKRNSCTNCGGSTVISGASSDCQCGCPTFDCNVDSNTRLLWCEKACLDEKINPLPNQCTLCNLNTECNLFYIQQPGYKGRCILDEMTFDQLITFLSRNPLAKEHLLKISSDPCLVRLANTVGLVVPIADQNLELQKKFNSYIPYYTLFRGNTDGSVH